MVIQTVSTSLFEQQERVLTFWRVPRGPVTVMTRALMVMSTPALHSDTSQFTLEASGTERTSRDHELLFLVDLLHGLFSQQRMISLALTMNISEYAASSFGVVD